MKEISAQDFQRNFADAQDKALVEPIAITRHGKPRLVVMSVEAYAQLRRTSRKAMLVSEMPQDLFDAIMTSQAGDKPAPPDKNRKD